MACSKFMQNEGLIIRRVGELEQATITLWASNDPQAPSWQTQDSTKQLVLPTQVDMWEGWQLTHACLTSSQEVKQNWVVDLFHDTRYLKSIRLHTDYLRNPLLLDSIASAFARLRKVGKIEGEGYGYDVVVPPKSQFDRGTPNLLYYKPLEGGNEQFLLLYQQFRALNERTETGVGRVNVYEIVQVELDEGLFLRLLREALEAGERAR